MMNRRSNDANGWVNFPIHESSFSATKQHRIFVELVVVDDRKNDERLGICSDVHLTVTPSQKLIADDRNSRPVYNDEHTGVENVHQHYLANWEEYHFPSIKDTKYSVYNSRAYLAAIVLGSTRCEWNEDRDKLWHCTYDDLNLQGKALYNSLQNIYWGCDLYLLTFLDTCSSH